MIKQGYFVISDIEVVYDKTYYMLVLVSSKVYNRQILISNLCVHRARPIALYLICTSLKLKENYNISCHINYL